MSEIWIYSNENKFFNIDGYHVHFSNRNSNRSGGCCIFVHNKILSTLINEIEFENSNFITIKLVKYDLHISCIYRYGHSNIKNFIQMMENNILKYNRTIIIGDININLQNNDHETRQYIDSFQSNGIICLNNVENNYYTRRSNTINTFIDHVLTNLIQNHFQMTLIDNVISDHRLILLSCEINITRSNSKASVKLKNQLQVIDFVTLEKDIESLQYEESFENFHYKFTDLVKDNTKTIEKKRIKANKPWVNCQLIYFIKQRDKYFKKKCKDTKNETLRIKFAEYKIKARNLKNFLKKTYYSKLIEKNLNDNRKTWKVLNSVMYNKQ